MSMQIKLLALSALAGLAACSSEPVRIVRDPALADAETFEVRGAESPPWRTPVTFGNFSTEQMDIETRYTSARETTLWGWTNDLFQVREGVRVSTVPLRVRRRGRREVADRVPCEHADHDLRE